MRVGFIGLGQMGSNMAKRLIERGHALTVYNRGAAGAAPFAALGASVVDGPRAALDAGIVITMLADDAALRAVWLAPGMIDALPQDTVHLNMASVSLAMGRELAALHASAGRRYVAAPVFGRPAVARAGELDIVAAGGDDAIGRCEALFADLGKRWFRAGTEPWQANAVKVARNFLLGCIIESLGEALALVGKAGVQREEFLRIVTSTSMSAPAFRNYGALMLDPPAEVTFPLRLGLKDIEIALDAARDCGIDLPSARLLAERHRAAIAAGFGERDWAMLGEYMAREAGLPPR